MKNKTKKSVVIFGIASFAVALTLFNSCSASGKNKETTKMTNTSENLIVAKVDLNAAKKEYQKKYEVFKIESEKKIFENEQAIAEFRAEAKNKNKSIKTDLDKKLTVLGQKNLLLKTKIRDYKVGDSDKWNAFKTEFNHDMDNLGQTLKDLTNKSVN